MSRNPLKTQDGMRGDAGNQGPDWPEGVSKDRVIQAGGEADES